MLCGRFFSARRCKDLQSHAPTGLVPTSPLQPNTRTSVTASHQRMTSAQYMVRGTGLEPVLPFGKQILNLQCLPFHHPRALQPDHNHGASQSGLDHDPHDLTHTSAPHDPLTLRASFCATVALSRPPPYTLMIAPPRCRTRSLWSSHQTVSTGRTSWESVGGMDDLSTTDISTSGRSALSLALPPVCTC